MTTAQAVGTEAPISRRRERRAWERRARLLMWAGLALAMFSLPFLSLPGRYVNDTRDALWLNPGAYLTHAFQLWHSSPYLGFEQHDGIVFPMATVVWLLRAVGLSAWAAERLWHGMLLFGAAAFTILLMDHLRGRRSVVAPLIAGLIYALSAFTFGYGLPFTGTFLAYVVLPLLVLIVLVGVRHRGLLWPAIFGVATFLMGGGNGAPQIYALVVCAALLAWLAAFDRTVRTRDAALFGAVSLAFFVGLNASWLFLLTSGEIQNALQYSEAPKVINVDSSVAESIRGVGLWLFYGGDAAGPWVPAVRPFLEAPALVIATFVVPTAALAAAWRTRWRLRLFFVLLAILSVILVSGIFPVTSPTPFGRALLWAYTHVPGVGGLRTTYKFAAAIELSLAVLVGMGVDPAISALRRLRRPALAVGTASVVAFVVIAANAYPLWSGNLYAERASMAGIPDYWKQALDDLGNNRGETRAYFAPAIDKATYRWGALKEGVTADTPGLETVVPIPLPVGERYGSNLLRATEQPYTAGTGVQATAVLMRYLGVSSMVLQNDLDWALSRTARPFSLQALAHAKDLRTTATYGGVGENVVDPSAAASADPFIRFERRLHPVQVLEVGDPLQIVRAEPSPPVVLSGDGFGLSTAASAGILTGNPAVLYSGTMSPAAVAEAESEGARFVVTDSNRRRIWSFTTPQGHASATLGLGSTGGRAVGYGLFSNRPSTQTVAVYPGLRAIRSSTDGTAASWAPQYRPALAFDGDPSTWWVAGAGGAAVGSWIEADLSAPRRISSLTISLPAAVATPRIDQVRIDLSTGTRISTAVRPGATTVRFPPTRVSAIRVTVSGVTSSPVGGRLVAIADLAIPGVRPTEILRTPTDLFDAARSTPGGLAALARAPLTFVFERARTATAGDRDEETVLARRFELPGAASYVFGGSARLDAGAPDQAIDRFLRGPSSIVVTSSSRRLGDPAVRGSAAFDGDPATSWQPDGTVGQWLAARFPPRRLASITVVSDASAGHTPITGMKAQFSDGTAVVGHPGALPGVIVFDVPARTVSSVKLTITSVYAGAGGARRLPVAIRAVDIPGVVLPPPAANASLPCTSTNATLDGAPLSLVATGTVKEALAGAAMPVGTCHGSPLGLGAGTHDLRIGGALQPDIVTLSSPGDGEGAHQASSAPPQITWTSPADGRYVVHISDATGPFYLTIGQNFSPRWRASIGAQDLGSPVILDGYSTGWFVTRAGTYTIDVRYGPQRLYDMALAIAAGSVAVAFAVILFSVVIGIRRRRKAAA